MRRVQPIGCLLFVLLSGVRAQGDPGGLRCEVRWLDPGELGSLSRAGRRPTADRTPDGGFRIVLSAGPTLAGNAGALAAWQMAAAQLEALIGDPVTVVINADLAPLGAGVIGSTCLTPFIASYDAVRGAMIADAGADESSLAASLPTFALLDAQVPGGYTLNDNVFFSTANCRALGLDCPALVDAAITFSTNFPFDFDPTDGIGFNQVDFVGVAVHEMMHALGFISIVDSVDVNLFLRQPPFAVPPTPLDLFRLTPGAGADDFTHATRLLAPGNQTPTHACYDGLVDLRFSEGFFNGDGHQASHWRDDALPPFFDFGIMDPTIAFGQRLEISARDVRALDLMGWDLVSQPGPDCNGNGLSDAQDVAGGSEDCNANAVPDACDISAGVSGDCNADAVPDECVLGDADGDDDVDLLDYFAFDACATPAGGGPIGGGCAVFDADCDDDVDLFDFGVFQDLFTGP